MTPDRDVHSEPQFQAFAPFPHAVAAPLDEAAARDALFQEINERRARIENAELLRHLRGL